MDIKTIEALMQIDYSTLFISVFIVLIGIKGVVTLFEWFGEKYGIETRKMRKQREDHDLLAKTSNDLLILQKDYEEDIQQLIKQDQQIQYNLATSISELKETIIKTQDDLKQFASKMVSESVALRDEQIKVLVTAQKEILCDKINQKYKYYLSQKYIPEDEFEEFTSLHTAYKKLGGNHSGDLKFEYCVKNLEVRLADAIEV